MDWRSVGQKAWHGSGGVLGLPFLINQFREDRAAGKSLFQTALSAGVTGYMWGTFMGPMAALTLGQMAGQYVPQAAMQRLGTMRQNIIPFGGQPFADTQNRATMRARAVQAMQQSRNNTRSVLGNEAGYQAQRYG